MQSQGNFSSIQNDVMFQKQINYALAHEEKPSANKRPLKIQSQGRSLDQVSASELENRLEVLKAKMVIINNSENKSPRAQRIKAKLAQAIEAIESELLRRKSESDAPVISNAPEKEVEKVQNIGTNVGLGALTVGIVGYITGSYLEKNAWAFGFGGAVLGAVGAYAIIKYKQQQSAASAKTKFTPKKN